ncbi:MAG: hypothetical protein HLX51_13370 [Micrococcaceae bacterium]|nr:hypothetical protein [Micrococcaceae bacterium]
MSSSAETTQPNDGDDVSTTYRSIAIILALVVIMGLGYGLVDTGINAAALFTE